eukprot:2870861-Amphidinium_carterae.1
MKAPDDALVEEPDEVPRSLVVPRSQVRYENSEYTQLCSSLTSRELFKLRYCSLRSRVPTNSGEAFALDSAGSGNLCTLQSPTLPGSF